MRWEFFILFIVVGVFAIRLPTKDDTIDEIIALAGDMKHGKVNPNGRNSPSGRKMADGQGIIIEYDIMLPLSKEAHRRSSQRIKRAAMQSQSVRWPSAIIPYTLDSNFTTFCHNVTKLAIAEFNKYTCLRIRPRTTETDYVLITNMASGCWSGVGRYGGAQRLNLQQNTGCCFRSIIIHEFLHAAGCNHEQSRTDRDSYVTINYANIEADEAYNFDIEPDEITYGIGYDYRSVMHYGRAAFSTTDGSDTITTLDPAYQNTIGRAPTLSFADIRLVNSMYDCASSCSPVSCPPNGFQGFNCLCFCPSSDRYQPVVNCGGGCLIPNQACNCQLRTDACSGIPNSVCNSVTKACVCASGYVIHNGRCTLITSITCTAPNIDCKCSLRRNACVGVLNTVCERASNKCVCKPGFRLINGRCVAIVG